ncbi:MAG TPA: 4'-phosphopantetheinyl transferase superfamily protein, partial [Chitinophagaceae bacterium]|nr:4'-phosphopantetheinyl transferase superfamily protein [Chitinophagaceae bacterium]
MPIFFQQQINGTTRLGIWKIEETEEFFLSTVPLQREVTHPHKRLQHLAGRFLLQFLFPGFPYDLIRIADTRKPYLPEEEYHFSISHCGDFAAAIVSSARRVGIDIEIPSPKVTRIKNKFLADEEISKFEIRSRWPSVPQFEIEHSGRLTLLWSAKESIFKWYGNGNVDFRQH